MLQIVDLPLPINEFSRPGRKMESISGLVYHYVGVRHQRPMSVWNYFAKDIPQKKEYGSAHYCIAPDGHIFRFIPDDEVAYHCGTNKKDPASQRIYTEWARQRFPQNTLNPDRTSPNFCTIGIELCFDGAHGEFTEPSLSAAAELGALLCEMYRIPADNIGTHHQVVGWKECPVYWAKNPEEFDRFRLRIIGLLKGRKCK